MVQPVSFSLALCPSRKVTLLNEAETNVYLILDCYFKDGAMKSDCLCEEHSVKGGFLSSLGIIMRSKFSIYFKFIYLNFFFFVNTTFFHCFPSMFDCGLPTLTPYLLEVYFINSAGSPPPLTNLSLIHFTLALNHALV